MRSIVLFFQKLTISKKIFILLTPLLSVLVTMRAMLLGLFILIFLDLLTGIRKTLHVTGISCNIFKSRFWKSIKSYLLRKTWRKTYEYCIGIISIIVIESLIIGSTPIELLGKSFTIAELGVIFPAGVEIWSIYENLEGVSGNNIIKKMVGFLPEPLQKILRKNV